MESPAKQTTLGKSWTAHKLRRSGIACLLIVALYLLALSTGAAFTEYGFSADSCWLLKFGKIIFQAMAIPASDPFTFSQLSSDSPPFIVYQWLSEVSFYCWLYMLKPAGVLAVAAAITVISFVLIPFRACSRTSVSSLWLIGAIIALSATNNSRSYVRPEMFTALFTANLFDAAAKNSTRFRNVRARGRRKIRWRSVIVFAALMMVWANMHTGFVTGLLALGLYSLFFVIKDHRRGGMSALSKTLCAAFVCSLSATLVNPYGIGLWSYLPHLFFAPMNAKIRELLPLVTSEYKENLSVVVFPIFSLLALCFGAITFALLSPFKKTDRSPLDTEHLLSLFMVVIASCIALFCRRLIALSGLIVLFETVNFCHDPQRSGPAVGKLLKAKTSYLLLEAVMLALLFVQHFSSTAPLRFNHNSLSVLWFSPSV